MYEIFKNVFRTVRPKDFVYSNICDVENMIGAMIGLKANCEAVIEFGEEEAIGDSDLLKEVKASIKQSILPQIISHIQQSGRAHV